MSADIVDSATDLDDDAMDLDDAVPVTAVSGSDLIEMAFSKKHVEERKTWLNKLEKNTFLDYAEAQIEGMKYSQFINRELILFSQADSIRSIPNIFDGLQPHRYHRVFYCHRAQGLHWQVGKWDRWPFGKVQIDRENGNIEHERFRPAQ